MTKTSHYDSVTKPLYATVGAGDALYNAVIDAVSQVRERTSGTDVTGSFTNIRERLGFPLPPKDINELRTRLSSEELRKTADDYRHSAAELYADLADRGENTVERLRADEWVGRLEELYNDALSRMSGQTKGFTDRFATKPANTTSTEPTEVDAEAELEKPDKPRKSGKTTKKSTETGGTDGNV
jgi:heparin binding hemagglutinin HbhA